MQIQKTVHKIENEDPNHEFICHTKPGNRSYSAHGPDLITCKTCLKIMALSAVYKPKKAKKKCSL